MSSLFPSPLWGDVRARARARMREGAVLSASQSRSLVKV